MPSKRPPGERLDEPRERGARDGRGERGHGLHCQHGCRGGGHTVKALSTANDDTRDHEPEMALKTATPMTQYEARMEEIDKTEKQESFEEVYETPDMKVISGN